MEIKAITNLRIITIIVFLVQVAVLAVLNLLFKQPFQLIAAIFTLIDFFLIAYTIFLYEKNKRDRVLTVTRVLGNDTKQTMIYGKVGLITYDDDYYVTWASELLDQYGINLIGERLTKSIPGSEILLNGDRDTAVFDIADRKFEIVRNESSQVLYIKDISEENDMRIRYENTRLVFGLIHLDNYDETIQYEDEQTIASINSNIRQRVVEWCQDYNGIVRRLRSDRFMVILNEENFTRMQESGFDVLEEVKTAAENLGVAITCSMAFSHGTDDLKELDNMVNELVELVLSRGGDQVAVRNYGEEVLFFGTSSETSEKTSKVRVRVIAQTLKGIIEEADNVFIVPHKEADYDAVGSALGISRFAQAFGKAVFVVLKDITIEASAKAALQENMENVEERHNLISEFDALEFITPKSVVIVCDHHSLDQCSAPRLIEQVRDIVVIDHHRRKQETNIEAMMIYNEPSSSSAVELVTELIEYQPARVELNDFEATYMYTGLLVDTDGFKARCSSRSFEACAYLRKIGADISQANEWLKDSIEQFETKNRVFKYSEIINGHILIAALPEREGLLTRALISQVANSALTIKDIDAAFVIAQVDTEAWAVSGRSNGKFNVQLVLEKMGGGGHFTAAGLQRTNTSSKILRDELIENIGAFLKGVPAK